MKTYTDSDETKYKLSEIKELTAASEWLDELDIQVLETMEIGERLELGQGEWIERIN